MKKYIVLIAIISTTLSCQKYDPVAPDACLKMKIITGKNDANLDVFTETTTCKVGEECYFSSCGSADLYSVWTGDEGHDYSKRDEREIDTAGVATWTNLGASLARDIDATHIHTYSTAGTYSATLIATNTSTGSTDVENIVSTTTLTITVTD